MEVEPAVTKRERGKCENVMLRNISWLVVKSFDLESKRAVITKRYYNQMYRGILPLICRYVKHKRRATPVTYLRVLLSTYM